MGDRNEYMKFYMRERRARLKAERLVAGGEPAPSQAARSTEPETTEGSGSFFLWIFIGLIFIGVAYACVQNWRAGTAEDRAGMIKDLNDALNQES